MTKGSAVQFETASRIHMGLAVKDLERSVAFYRTLFGQGPTKTRPGYAKFEVAEPPVNLSLNEVGGATGPNNPVTHYGIQVKSTAAVEAVAGRLARAGLQTKTEENVTCCYAVQDKVWAADPDGNKWEVYVVLDDGGTHHHSSAHQCGVDTCCSNLAASAEPEPSAQDKSPDGSCAASCGCGGTTDAAQPVQDTCRADVGPSPCGCAGVADAVTKAEDQSPAGACCPDLPAIMEAVQRGDLAGAASAFEKAGGMSACSCLTNAAG